MPFDFYYFNGINISYFFYTISISIIYMTAFFSAVLAGNIEIVKLFLDKKKFDIDIKNILKNIFF